MEAEEIYKLLQNLHENGPQRGPQSRAPGATGTAAAAAQYRYRKEQEAAAAADAGAHARRRMHEAKEQQQARQAAARMKEQMDRMHHKASARAEAERKAHTGAGPANQHSALQTLAVLAAERELRELNARYGLHLASAEGRRIKELLVQRAMVSGSEWAAVRLVCLACKGSAGLTGVAWTAGWGEGAPVAAVRLQARAEGSAGIQAGQGAGAVGEGQAEGQAEAEQAGRGLGVEPPQEVGEEGQVACPV